MNTKLWAFFAAFLPILAWTQTPPVFPNQYELGFNQSSSIGPFKGDTTGRMYVDVDNNKEFISRKNGNHDRYCGSVFKLTNTPCNHYVVESTAYLYYRQKIPGFP